MQKMFIAVLLAALSNVVSAAVVYHVDLEHATSRIVSFELAARGSDRFHAMPVAMRNAGGGVTVAIRKDQGDCVRDLRIGLADGRRIVHRDFDVCRLTRAQAGENLQFAARR